MNYLVTGGSGFIGSHLATALLERGHSVRVIDDLSTGREANLAHLDGKVDVVRGSITDPGVMGRAAAGMDGIFHLAAMASVPRSVADPVRTEEVNVQGTTRVLLAARDAGVKRVVISSSSSVYGDATAPPTAETARPRPLSPYAAQKLMAEHLAAMAQPLWGVEAVCVRYFNVFGPRQDPQSDYAAVIPKFAALLLRGEAPTIFGDGLQSRDFTYVANAVDGTIRAMEAGEQAIGEVYNVACGDRFTVLDLARTMARLAGHPEVEPKHAPERAGDVKHSQAAIGKAREHLGFEPLIGFEAGLERTVAWYREALGG